MDISKAFDKFQSALAADKEDLTEARRRRDLFVTNLGNEDDVKEAYPSGSLARKTMLEPLNDVDVVVVLRPSHSMPKSFRAWRETLQAPSTPPLVAC